MKLVKYQDIRSLLPEDTHYKNERYYDAEEAWVLHYVGDLVLENHWTWTILIPISLMEKSRKIYVILSS